MFDFDHIAISAENLEETLSFYYKFGFVLYKEYHDENVDIVMLEFNSVFLEIFHYNENFDLPEHSKELLIDLKTIGNKHFALRVKDINEAKQWIEDKNLNNSEIKINKGRLGRNYFFIKDPNGILMEIIEDPEI